MWADIFFNDVCPFIGVITSCLLFFAPVSDLRDALVKGSLGALNPKPWAVMVGNNMGWIAYAYYKKDPFILASNIPGILVGSWLSIGAAKLQYYEQKASRAPTCEPREDEIVIESNAAAMMDARFVLAPQESLLLKMITLWFVILVSVGWLGLIPSRDAQAETIGILVIINLCFFYGAPLQTMKQVIREKCSASIHRKTMVTNWVNTSFWVLYGLVGKNDPIIYGPNALGLFFGIISGILCWKYPLRLPPAVDSSPILVNLDIPVDSSPTTTKVMAGPDDRLEMTTGSGGTGSRTGTAQGPVTVIQQIV